MSLYNYEKNHLLLNSFYILDIKHTSPFSISNRFFFNQKASNSYGFVSFSQIIFSVCLRCRSGWRKQSSSYLSLSKESLLVYSYIIKPKKVFQFNVFLFKHYVFFGLLVNNKGKKAL